MRTTVWLNGSGGADKTTSHYRAISGKTRLIRERRSRCPLVPVLGSLLCSTTIVIPLTVAAMIDYLTNVLPKLTFQLLLVRKGVYDYSPNRCIGSR